MASDFKAHHKALGALAEWGNQLTRTLTAQFQTLQTQANSQVQGIQAAIASAGTITATPPTQHVTGTVTITTINAPAGFSGPLWLISDNGFTLGTGGNIAAGTAAITAGRSVQLIYDPASAMWYPHVGI